MRVPIKPKVPGGAIATKTLSFERDIDHEDFFDRVRAYMDLHRDEAQLGYKWNFERRRDPAHRLLTSEDLTDAFRKAIHMSNSKRRKKEVIMEVVDLTVSATAFRSKSIILTSSCHAQNANTFIGLKGPEKMQKRTYRSDSGPTNKLISFPQG